MLMSAYFKRINWYSFWVQRQKCYDVVNKVVVTSLWGLIGYLTVNGFLMWSEGMNRVWLQYVKKERERAELIELIREAREDCKLPPE